MNEGYIKFQFRKIPGTEPALDDVLDLIELRTKLYELGLLGAYENVSYGNVSKRVSKTSFIITASNTGKTKSIGTKDLVTIVSVDIENNLVNYIGEYPPSSETLTHYAIYETFQFALFVVHFHHKQLWGKLSFKLPTTPIECEYGTIQLAKAIARQASFFLDHKDAGVIVLGGHPDGLIAFGKSVDIVLKTIDKLLQEL